jgi:GNAT superfamily N-acetyltransferase
MATERVFISGYRISDDQQELDIDTIHGFLSQDSYWAQGRPRCVTEAAIRGSLALGLYAPNGSLAGFARAVTDRATAAHLSDVFILPMHRGQGLGQALVAAMLEHPELGWVRRWTLSTNDAHGLYARFGFAPFEQPTTQMVRIVSPVSVTEKIDGWNSDA